MTCNEPRKLAVRHHLALLDGALATIREHGEAILQRNVALAQRGDAERLVLLEVPLAAHAEEAFADEPHNSCRYGLACRRLRARIGTHPTTDGRQRTRQLAHTVVLPELPPLHR